MTTTRRGSLALTIEGLGTADGLYRFIHNANASPVDIATVDADGLYVDALLGWPAEISNHVDFLRGEPRMGGQTYQLARTTQTLLLWDQRGPIALSADSTVTASQTTLKFKEGLSASLAGTVIHWEREAIVIGTASGTSSGVTTYTGCTRGALGTLASAHNQTAASDPEVFAGLSVSREGRIVQLYFVPADAASYGDEELMWSGTLSSLTSKAGVMTLGANPILSLLTGAKICRNMWFAGNGRVGQGTQLKPAAGYSGDMRMLCLEGDSHLTVRSYREGPTRYTLTLDLAPQEVPGSPPRSRGEGGLRVQEVITNLPQQPANSASPGINTLPLSTDPHTLLMQLLTTTANGGSPGANGAYDTGVDQIAGGIRNDLVDSDGIEDFCARFLPAALDNVILGASGEEDLWALCKNIARLGGGVWTQSGGKITIAALRDIAPFGTQTSLTIADMALGAPDAAELDASLGGAVAAATVKYNRRPGQDDYVQEVRGAYSLTRLPPGSAGRAEFDAGVISDFRTSRTLAYDALERYQRQPAVIKGLPFLRTVTAQIGDVVLLTADFIISDRALSVTNRAYLVYGRSERIDGPSQSGARGQGHVVRLWLADVGAIHKQLGYIAPTATVNTYAPGPPRLTVNANDYTATDGPITTDAGGFAAGDVIQICDQYYTLRQSGLVVQSVAGNIITLENSPALSIIPASGDIVRVAPYTSQVAAQIALWSSVAPSGGLDGDTGNDYTYPTG